MLLSSKKCTAPWQVWTASNVKMLLHADPLLLILPGAFANQQVGEWVWWMMLNKVKMSLCTTAMTSCQFVV